MEVSRRDAVGMMAALVALTSSCEPRVLAQAITNAPSHAVDVDDYWSGFYTDNFSKGAKGLPQPERETKYLYAADSGKPITWADTIPPTSLPPIDGDVLVKVAVSQFRPGSGDVSDDVSHLRLDAAQPFDLMNVVAPLNWAAIASITPSTRLSKIPTLDQLGFKASAADPTGITQITLPNGIGHLAINVTRPANTTFSELLSAASVSLNAALGIFNVPAISGPAANAFTKLLGKWQSHATVVMNGNLTPVIATSKLPEPPLAQTPMALPSGYLVMVPHKHQAELESEMKNLQMMNGFLVNNDPSETGDLVERAAKPIKGVSYVTLRVYATKAPAGSGCGAKVDGPKLS